MSCIISQRLQTLKSWFCSVGTSLDFMKTCTFHTLLCKVLVFAAIDGKEKIENINLKIGGVSKAVEMHCHSRASMYVRTQYPVASWGYFKRDTRPDAVLTTESLLERQERAEKELKLKKKRKNKGKSRELPENSSLREENVPAILQCGCPTSSDLSRRNCLRQQSDE